MRPALGMLEEMRLCAQPVALVDLLALAAGQLAYVVPELSERIATHFCAGGNPNGWMTRTGFVFFEVALVGFMVAVMIGAALLARVLPGRFINIPNRDYWLAPERRHEAASRLLGHMLWLACWAVALFVAVNHLVFAANRVEGCPRLSEKAFIVLLAAALVGLVVWIARMFVLFRRTR